MQGESAVRFQQSGTFRMVVKHAEAVERLAALIVYPRHVGAFERAFECRDIVRGGQGE